MEGFQVFTFSLLFQTFIIMCLGVDLFIVQSVFWLFQFENTPLFLATLFLLFDNFLFSLSLWNCFYLIVVSLRFIFQQSFFFFSFPFCSFLEVSAGLSYNPSIFFSYRIFNFQDLLLFLILMITTLSVLLLPSFYFCYVLITDFSFYGFSSDIQ